MQITEALISEPGDIRRFVQQAVDHWPNLLAFHFTLYSAEGNINGQQIHAFCTSFYRQVHERITERNHTACPSSPVYYAGCGNNMEEQQYDACCCSARRAFAIRGPVPRLMKNVRNGGFIATDLEGDKRWRTMPG
ncbi:hypothetical protein MS8345_04722 [Escherichia coli]|nr:hypothetical protein MS8345_04722 [Escherichia coli]